MRELQAKDQGVKREGEQDIVPGQSETWAQGGQLSVLVAHVDAGVDEMLY